MTIERRLAEVFSALFHPLLMPVMMLFVIFNLNTYITFSIPPGVRNLLYAVVLLTTCLIPGFLILWMYRREKIDDLEVSDYQQRRVPYLVTSVFYALTYWLISKTPLPAVIQLMVLGASLSVIITMLINLFWKISAHMVAMGGAVGALIGISFRFMIDIHTVICAFILIAGLLGYSRMKLEAHTQGQVYAGFLAGFFCQSSLLLMHS